MAGKRSRAQRVLTALREVARIHLRTIAPLAAVVVSGIVVVFVLSAVYAQIIGVTAYQSMIEQTSFDALTTSVAAALAPLVAIALLAAFVWVGTAVLAASAAVDKRRAGMITAAWTSLKRAPRALAVIIVVIAAFLGAILAAPVFLIVGIIGLITRRGTRERNIAMAIPFGVAALVLVRWSLALPAVYVDGLKVRAALAESSRRVRGRGLSVAVILVISWVVGAGLSEAAALLVPDPLIQLAVRVVALMLFGALPFVAMTVLYRRDLDGTKYPTATQPAPLTRRARIATAVTLSMVLPLMVTALPATAQSAAAATPVTVFLSTTDDESLVGVPFALTAQVVGLGVTGTVRFEAIPDAGGAPIDLGTETLDFSAGAAVHPSTLPVGDYVLKAYYSGDAGNDPGTSAELDHSVITPKVAIGVTSTYGGAGDTANLSVTVTPAAPAGGTASGTVTVTGGGHTVGPVTLDGAGKASIPVNVTTFGTRDLTVSYVSSNGFDPKSTVFSVPRLATGFDITDPNPRSAVYGDAQTFAGEVTTTTGTVPTGEVELWWRGALVTTGPLTGGAFSITTTKLRADTNTAFLIYRGDANHLDATSAGISIEVDKVTVNPVVTIDTATPRIYDTMTVTADFGVVGNGPSQWVTLTDGGGTNYGDALVAANGKATFSFVPKTAITFLSASYPGDSNFESSIGALRVDSDRANPTITITDPGTVEVGDLFDLEVTMSIGTSGSPGDHTVNFETSTGDVLKANVPLVFGRTATVSFCARVAADCPAGNVALGVTPLDIVVTYSESPRNYYAESDPYEYDPTKIATTTALTVTPKTILYGSGVFLTATVDTSAAGVTPTGHVTFYAETPGVVPGVPKFELLGSDTLDSNGEATLTTQSGNTAADLQWPAYAIQAEYSPDGAPYQGSADNETIDIIRIGTTLDAYVAATKPAGTPTPISYSLTHDPGASASFTGTIEITADNGTSCTITLPATSCPITWNTVGSHYVDARYSGDLVYLPDDAPRYNVSSGMRTPVLAPTTATTDVLVGANVTVTWSQFDVATTGDVTVWGDGTQWCKVPVNTLSCTGTFTNASATGGFVDIRVRYDGDANWNGVEEIRKVRVIRCAVLDVRTNNSSLGTVAVNTAPNCGPTGYLPSTTISVTATPKAPAELEAWLGYTAHKPNLTPVSTTLTHTWQITSDSQTWVRVAKFRVPCYPVTADPTGFGGISVYPASNCVTDAGAPGYSHGTTVAIYPDGAYNRDYDENDAFHAWGTMPPGAVIAADKAGRTKVDLTVTSATVIPVIFGPQCRQLSIVLDPASPGDHAETTTPKNCFSPTGNGYLRFTKVDASVASGDATLALTGWTLDGKPAPELGTTNEPSVLLESLKPVLKATLVHCYAVDLTYDNAVDLKNNPVGEVRVEPAANCPDGSNRYTAGTPVKLTPVVLVKGGAFNGWGDVALGASFPAGDTGDVTSRVRSEIMKKDLALTAGFFLESGCSKLTVRGDASLIELPLTGCGAGFYADMQKAYAKAAKVPQSSVDDDKLRSSLFLHAKNKTALDLYVTVASDTGKCFTGLVASSGAGDTYGPMKGDFNECRIGGPTAVWPQACQTVVINPVFHVDGKTETFPASAMPGTMNLPGLDGVVHEYSMSNFRWGQAWPVNVEPDGTLLPGADLNGPCAETGYAFAPNTDIALFGAAPSAGFVFEGWSDVGETAVSGVTMDENGVTQVSQSTSIFAQNPVHRLTTATQNTIASTAHFSVVCHTLSLGTGLTVEGDATRCPGSRPEDNSFVEGTAVKVRATYQIGDRYLQKYTKGVVNAQIYEDPMTLELVAYAVVDKDKVVEALYQNQKERENAGILQGLKFTAGFFAVAAPIFAGMLWPPVGIYFAAMGAAAGLLNMVPGLEKAAAVFDLLNPTKITQCAARWAFNKGGDPTGGANAGSILSTLNTIRKVRNGVDVLVEPVGPVGAAGGLVSFGYGLYDAGIGGNKLGETQSVEDINDTANMTNCLDQQWSIVGSDITGDG